MAGKYEVATQYGSKFQPYVTIRPNRYSWAGPLGPTAWTIWPSSNPTSSIAYRLSLSLSLPTQLPCTAPPRSSLISPSMLLLHRPYHLLFPNNQPCTYRRSQQPPWPLSFSKLQQLPSSASPLSVSKLVTPAAAPLQWTLAGSTSEVSSHSSAKTNVQNICNWYRVGRVLSRDK